MSLRSLRIPGEKLGIGTFVNNDIDAKRNIVYFGKHTWTAGSTSHAFTQGVTRMATVKSVITSYSILAGAKASGSVCFSNSTLTNGTVTIRLRPKLSAANTNVQNLVLHYWIAGTVDPERIIV
jgi:hypothetical protein